VGYDESEKIVDRRGFPVNICIVTQMSKDTPDRTDRPADPERARPGCDFLAELCSPELFKALCDPMRLGILARLATAPGPRTIGDIASACPVDFSVVSRHVRLLKDAGVVICEKRGREVFCRIDGTRLAGRLRALADVLEACCGAGAPPAPSDEKHRAGSSEERAIEGGRS